MVFFSFTLCNLSLLSRKINFYCFFLAGTASSNSTWYQSAPAEANGPSTSTGDLHSRLICFDELLCYWVSSILGKNSHK